MRENVNETKTGMEVDLQKLLGAYLRKWWLIVLSALVVGGIFLYYTINYVSPEYRAGVTIIVNNRTSDKIVEEITGSNLAAAQRLVDTYVNIISSETVLTRVVESANLEYSVEEVRSMMTTQQIGETEMFQVFATHTDPEIAAQVVNAIATEALESIEEFVEGSSAKVVDYARVPTERYYPSYSKSGILGAVIGGVVAVLYVTIRYLLDVRLKTSEDLESIFELPVLGQIPVFVSSEAKGKSGYGYYVRKTGYGYEASRPKDTEGKEQIT